MHCGQRRWLEAHELGGNGHVNTRCSTRISNTAPATRPQPTVYAARTQEDGVGILRERIIVKILPVEPPRKPTNPTLPNDHSNPTEVN